MTNLDETLLGVWRQALVENLKIVAVGTDTVSVRTTPKRNLQAGRFRVSGTSVSRPGAKSRYEITMGGYGAKRIEGYAVFGAWCVYRGGR